jgi:hypothetical protein
MGDGRTGDERKQRNDGYVQAARLNNGSFSTEGMNKGAQAVTAF